MHLIDTHAHLFDPALACELSDVLLRAQQAGVRQIINVATTAASSESVLRTAEKHHGLFASAGIHPNYAHEPKEDHFDRVVALVAHEKVVALGETGLDRYWDDCPWDVQLANFEKHLQLGLDTGLPLIIHTRDCYPEMIEVLQRYTSRGKLHGVMHSFAGTLEQASELLEIGMYISFAGMLTYKKSNELQETAKSIPLDRLLVETDSPYLSPEPFRGKKPNEPARVIYTAGKLAELFGLSLLKLSEITTRNARQLFAKMTNEVISNS